MPTPDFFLLADVDSWWGALSGPRQFFFVIALVSGVIAAALTVFALVGLDGGATPELDTGDIGGDAEGFSLRAVTGFFLAFGAGGYVATGEGLSLALAVPIALVAGFAMFLVIRQIFRAFGKLKSDGTLRYENAVGATGTAYIEIPAEGSAGGQANITFSGRLETLPAVHRGASPLKAGTRLKVVAVEGRILVVEPA